MKELARHMFALKAKQSRLVFVPHAQTLEIQLSLCDLMKGCNSP